MTMTQGVIAALTAAALLAFGAGPSAAQDAAPAGPQAAPPAQSPQAAPAEDELSESVAAIVNDDIISSYDLRQRMMLLIITSGVQPTQESLPQLQREALRSLVDESLQLQELRKVEKEQKFEIVANDTDVSRQIDRLARDNQLTGEQLLRTLTAAGVNPETLRQQLRAEISWQRWINGRYGTRLKVGGDQVNAFIQRLNAASARPQYLISEIYIDAARVGGMEVARSGAQQLVQQLQQGAPFAAVARQFSASPTAAAGGDAGWLSVGEMPTALEPALEQLRPGQLSQPIPVSEGVYIVYLRDKRAGAGATLVNLKQAAVRLAPGAGEGEIAAAQQKLIALKPRITSCSVMEAAAEAAGGVLAGDLGEAEIDDLAPAFRDAAQTLEVDQVSDPIRTSVGLHLVAVCGKRASGAPEVSKDLVEDRLYSQQLAMISKRYLRDLRNSATIETR